MNIKKYTKEQMAKMVEDAQEKNAALEAEIAELKNCIDEKNDLIAEYANLKAAMQRKNAALTEQIANLKADADVLRNKLADTEAALGRANAELGAAEGALGEMNDKIVRCEAYSRTLRRDVNKIQLEKIGAIMRADYAEAHPWRNLWAWIKRNLKMA